MKVKTKAKERLIIALDTSSETEALNIIESLSEYTGYFKVGLELFTSLGPKIIKQIKEAGNKVFFDGKFMDIPNTVSKAVANMVMHRVDMLNLYMSGGTKMIEEASKSLVAASERYNLNPPKLLGVTVLTSMTSDVLENDLKITTQLNEYVSHLATLAIKNNLDGIICSPNEAKLIKEVARKNGNQNFLIVTPGVRPSWAKADDQQRIATPKEAIENGASHIVVGRPITQAKNQIEATKKVLEEIEEAIK